MCHLPSMCSLPLECDPRRHDCYSSPMVQCLSPLTKHKSFCLKNFIFSLQTGYKLKVLRSFTKFNHNPGFFKMGKDLQTVLRLHKTLETDSTRTITLSQESAVSFFSKKPCIPAPQLRNSLKRRLQSVFNSDVKRYLFGMWDTSRTQ